jgi:hypothetical protein
VKEQADATPMAEGTGQKLQSNEAVTLIPAAQPFSTIENPDPQPSLLEDLTKDVPTALDGNTEDVEVESPATPADRLTTPVPPSADLEKSVTEVSLGTEVVQSNSGEHRGTLHLSISNKSPQPVEASPDGKARPKFADNSAAQSVETERPAPTRNFVHHNSAPNGPLENGGKGNDPVTAIPHQARGGAAFIDRALRQRVDGDISAFLAAFDAALADDTIESRAGLREATDRLLRAGARTRIELERLEARSPLSAREAGGYSAQNSRLR